VPGASPRPPATPTWSTAAGGSSASARAVAAAASTGPMPHTTPRCPHSSASVAATTRMPLMTIDPNRPHVGRIYETVLYGSDLEELAAFYRDVLGLRLVDGPDELMAGLRLPDGGVLLLFDPEVAGQPGRLVPSHGTRGAGHVAFSVPPGELEGWRESLASQSIEIEQEMRWGDRGRSIYVRDPAGNSVELVDGDIWPL
jgi:catechol 2,3-dioxygenase-like lactoylglutathione lyase family enzyme